MNRVVSVIALLSLLCPLALADASKTYQVTADTIVVDKDGEQWEIQTTDTTNVVGKTKVGSKVTVKYRMTAVRIEAKGKK